MPRPNRSAPMQLCPQKVKAAFQNAHTQLKITCIALANFFLLHAFHNRIEAHACMEKSRHELPNPTHHRRHRRMEFSCARLLPVGQMREPQRKDCLLPGFAQKKAATQSYPKKANQIWKKSGTLFSPTHTHATTESIIFLWYLQGSNPKFYISSATALKIKFQILCWNCPNRTYFYHRTAFFKWCSASLHHCLGLPFGSRNGRLSPIWRPFQPIQRTQSAAPHKRATVQNCRISAIIDQKQAFKNLRLFSLSANKSTLKISAFFALWPSVPAHPAHQNHKLPPN